MAHNIDFSNDQANIAYLGKRENVWHRLGQEMLPGMDIETWAKAAGLAHEVIKVPAYAHLEGDQFAHLDEHIRRVKGKHFLARSDTGGALGLASDRHNIVQPRGVLEWFQQYISVDDRFEIDVAGSLKGGAIVWATAKFRKPVSVAGDAHVCHLLMTTSYDGTMATLNKPTTTRVVCNNTLDVALASQNRAVVSTRHSQVFDGRAVALELAEIASGFEAYKAMGEAMTKIVRAEKQVQEFFNSILGVNQDNDEVSTRKKNQLAELNKAYNTTLGEGAVRGSNWALLQAVTRYVDHARIANDNKADLSAMFGSGAALKQQAFRQLLAA